jgi:hypothetical protein
VKFKSSKKYRRLLKFTDGFGDTVKVDNPFLDGSHVYLVAPEVVSMPREDAIAFAKAILKELDR